MRFLVFILVGICCLSLPSFGQITIQVEYNRAAIDASGLNGFVDSFNEFWGSQLASPYESYDQYSFSMPNVGLGYRFIAGEKAGFTANTHVLYGQKEDTHASTWTTGVQNEVNTRLRDIRWNFSMGIHWKSLLFVEGFFGSTFRSISLKHYTIYPDGSRSLSSEYKLNGLYRGTTTAIDLGFQVSLKLGPLLLFGRISNPMNNFPPAKDIVALSDANTVNFPPNDFPTNYAVWATEPIRFVEEDLGLKTDSFEGRRMTIGLELLLAKKKKP